MEKIILASSSPRRKMLLEQIGIKFEVISSDIEEIIDYKLTPQMIAVELAKQKGNDVKNKLLNSFPNINENKIIIAADTIVINENKILGKPKDEDDAFNMLSALSGKWHNVITGLIVLDLYSEFLITDYSETKVKIKEIEQKDIINYINTKEPMDKAGAYGIQGYGATIVDKIEGCYYNVVGLPISKIYDILKKIV